MGRVLPCFDSLEGGPLDMVQFAIEGRLGQRVSLPLQSGGRLSCTVRAPKLRLCEFVVDLCKLPGAGFGLAFRQAHADLKAGTTGAVVRAFPENAAGDRLRADAARASSSSECRAAADAVRIGDRLSTIGVAMGDEALAVLRKAGSAELEEAGAGGEAAGGGAAAEEGTPAPEEAAAQAAAEAALALLGIDIGAASDGDLDVLDATWGRVMQILKFFPEGAVARMTFRRVEYADLTRAPATPDSTPNGSTRLLLPAS
jgi:hypothetical protein